MTGRDTAGAARSGGRAVHPIEVESYRILRAAVETGHLPPYSRDVAERIVHTTADPAWVTDLVLDEAALAAGAAALATGAPLIVDVTMVAAGVTRYPSRCLVASPAAAQLASEEGLTRSAAAVRLAAAECPDGAVWAVGNAPTALYELLRLAASGAVTPALVIGLPVGYVGAADAKAALRASTLPQLSNLSARGGSAVTAAALNALLYGNPLPTPPHPPTPPTPPPALSSGDLARMAPPASDMGVSWGTQVQDRRGGVGCGGRVKENL